ncbi:MAG: ArsR family transcriptional regulator [Thermoplasmatota archaeon]
MRRIKVVSEPTDLVPVLRAFDTDVKRDIFRRLAEDWMTTSAIKAAYGAAGLDALSFFEKTKLVETKWEAAAGKTEKAYRSYYTSFHLNTTGSVQEITEILAVASMSEPEFHRVELEIEAMVGAEGFSARAITEKLGIPLIRLRSLLKRSTKLEFKGHLVRKLE